MNLKHLQTTLSGVLKQRNFAYVVSSILLLTNGILAYKLVSQEEHCILIPWPETHKRLPVSRTTYTEPYLIEWADSLTSRLLIMNPQTADQRVYEFLLVAESAGSLSTKLKAQASKLKQENISTAFYPKSYEHDAVSKRMWVKGDFHTFFGGDRSPIIQQKTVVLTYRKGHLGMILVKDFNYEG